MFTVTRGDIAVKSVSAAYMLNDTTGYIRIKSFGERTYAEMLAALQTLNIRGADHLVIDLVIMEVVSWSLLYRWLMSSFQRIV